MSQNIERIDAKPPPPLPTPLTSIHHIPAVLIFPCTPIVVDPPPPLPLHQTLNTILSIAPLILV